MVLTRKHLNQGRTLRKPKRIKPLKENAPAFRERKVVKSKRNKHPFLMERKVAGEIEGYKLTTHPSKNPRFVRLPDLSKKSNKHSYADSKRIRTPLKSLWLPKDYRGLKASKSDMKRIRKKSSK